MGGQQGQELDINLQRCFVLHCNCRVLEDLKRILFFIKARQPPRSQAATILSITVYVPDLLYLSELGGRDSREGHKHSATCYNVLKYI
jgi:hypothetical protein